MSSAQQGRRPLKTRSFARELQPRGARVNAVSPGPIETGILERTLPGPPADAAPAQMTANNPMGRFGRPDEVARAVLFLGFKASYTTGAELTVDGGTTHSDDLQRDEAASRHQPPRPAATEPRRPTAPSSR